MFLEKLYHIEETFTSQFCDNFIKLGEQKKLKEAKIQDGNQVNRKSKVSWINKQQVDILKTINNINIKPFVFLITKNLIILSLNKPFSHKGHSYIKANKIFFYQVIINSSSFT